MQLVHAIPLPAKFTSYGYVTAKSGAGARSEGDSLNFSNVLFLFSPHYFNIGLVGQYTDANGPNNNTGRGGVYASIYGEFKEIATSYFFLPIVFPIHENDNQGRFHLEYIVTIMKKFGILGSFIYIRRDSVGNSISSRPGVFLEILPGISLQVYHDYNSTLSQDPRGLQYGLNLKAQF